MSNSTTVYELWVEGRQQQADSDCDAAPGEGVTGETQMFLFVCGCLVFFLQAGFACLEAGSIGSTAVTNVLFKNLCDAMIGAVVWWAMGYGFAFGDSPGLSNTTFIGDNHYFFVNVNQCKGTFWFYQWTFAATCSTIISGAMAGRTNLVAYFVYSVVVTGFIYPVIVHWTWSNNAWLYEKGYVDFAGSGIVHVTGGIAALIGAYMVGPRDIQARRGSTPPGTPLPNGQPLSPAQIHRIVATNHSMPLVALGTIILIFGFFGFNGGSVLSMDSAADGRTMGIAVISTVMAASGGSIAASGSNYFMNKRWSLVQACNGAIAGMVAICASADRVDTWAAWVIGIFGGFSFRLWSWGVKKAGIDDAVDAAAVHAGAGIWGVIAAPMFDNTIGVFYQGMGSTVAWNAFGWHVLGILIIVLWTSVTSMVMFGILSSADKLRVPDESLKVGLDKHEHGEWAYGYDKRVIDEAGKGVEGTTTTTNTEFAGTPDFNPNHVEYITTQIV